MQSAAIAFVFKAFDVKMDSNSSVLPLGLPSSLMREDIPKVWGDTHMQYVVSPKADGTRMVLGFFTFNDQRVAFLMDRSMSGKIVNCTATDCAFEGTVLDCEVLPDGRLWVFDALCINGHTNVRIAPYTHRLQAAEVFLGANGVDKREWQVAAPSAIRSMGHWLHLGQLTVSVKPVWYHTNPNDAHAWGERMLPLDGLVYTPQTRVVAVFRSLNVFKWKTAEQHTVDFAVRPVDGEPSMMDLYATDVHRRLEHFRRVPLCCDDKCMVLVPGSVYECRLDRLCDQWSVLRARPDRRLPNAMLTVDRTCQNIEEDVRLEQLVPHSV